MTGEAGADTVAVIAQQQPEAMEVLLRQTVEADAAVAREGSEFAVLSRQVAVGGQLVELQGLGGVYIRGRRPQSAWGRRAGRNPAIGVRLPASGRRHQRDG
ncbi:folylpolyglutamate synthase FolC [Mycobacteroides abscessus subsp. abscessus]|nr:folylpolyglutamate synthase FolC [Mycobacteroides abscessus subsp. abscessus]